METVFLIRVSVLARIGQHPPAPHIHDSRHPPKRGPRLSLSALARLVPDPREQSTRPGAIEEEKKEKKGEQACLRRCATAKADLRRRPSSRALHQQKQALEVHQLIPRQSCILVLPLEPSFLPSVTRVRGSNSLSSCSSPCSSLTSIPRHSLTRRYRLAPQIQLSTRVRFPVHVKSIEVSTHSQTTHHLTHPVAISTPCLPHTPLPRLHFSTPYQANQLLRPSTRACSVM